MGTSPMTLLALTTAMSYNIEIVSSAAGTDNYFKVVVEPNGHRACHGIPLLLGHYAENHFVSLDIESNGIAVIFKCLFCDLFHSF